MMFASDFSGLMPILVGVPAGAVLIGCLSLYLAHRGHWSALLLAIPCTLLGALLSLVVLREGAMISLAILFFAPLVVGVWSIALWRARVKERKAAVQPTPTAHD